MNPLSPFDIGWGNSYTVTGSTSSNTQIFTSPWRMTDAATRAYLQSMQQAYRLPPQKQTPEDLPNLKWLDLRVNELRVKL